MRLSAQPTVEAGGRWKMSVYDLQEAVSANGLTSSSSAATSSSSTGPSAAPGDVGGDTPVADREPVESGNRAFTVVNNCAQKLRIGSTGGR